MANNMVKQVIIPNMEPQTIHSQWSRCPPYSNPVVTAFILPDGGFVSQVGQGFCWIYVKENEELVTLSSLGLFLFRLSIIFFPYSELLTGMIPLIITVPFWFIYVIF